MNPATESSSGCLTRAERKRSETVLTDDRKLCFHAGMTTEHRTRVSIHNGMYVVICDLCDRVGQPQDFEGDAEAIAARHQDIGGFERRSS